MTKKQAKKKPAIRRDLATSLMARIATLERKLNKQLEDPLSHLPQCSYRKGKDNPQCIQKAEFSWAISSEHQIMLCRHHAYELSQLCEPFGCTGIRALEFFGLITNETSTF